VGPGLSESGFRAVLLAFGVSQLALAAWMIVSPGSFFDAIAGFGGQNDHYIRDNATFPLAIGIGLLLAAGRPSWRFPVLLVSAVWYLAHAVNHLVDIGDSDPDWVGPADFVVILVTGLLLAWLASVAAHSDVRTADRRGNEPS
jgi:hypothetical protein